MGMVSSASEAEKEAPTSRRNTRTQSQIMKPLPSVENKESGVSSQSEAEDEEKKPIVRKITRNLRHGEKTQQASVVRRISRKNVESSAEDQSEMNEKASQPRRSSRNSRLSITQSKAKSVVSKYKKMPVNNPITEVQSGGGLKKQISEGFILNAHKTPMNQRTISRTVSTSSVNRGIMNSGKTVGIMGKSPLPSTSRVTSTLNGSSRTFLSSKTASRIVSKLGPGSGGNTPGKNIVKGLSSFLPMKPAKPTVDELKAKAEDEAKKKRAKEEEAIKRKEELAKMKLEEKKQMREARMNRVKENQKNMLSRQASFTDEASKNPDNIINKIKATRAAETQRKKVENASRLKETEERRGREEAAKEARLKEQMEAEKAKEEKKLQQEKQLEKERQEKRKLEDLKKKKFKEEEAEKRKVEAAIRAAELKKQKEEEAAEALRLKKLEEQKQKQIKKLEEKKKKKKKKRKKKKKKKKKKK